MIEGEAIRIHPLVCTAYNADFDGDQMAVHVPLSVEAQMEARMLMLAPNNIFSPSSGKPIMTPSQDITLGCYYLTQNPRRAVGSATESRLPLFANAAEVVFAMADGKVKTHDRIRFKNPDLGKETIYGNSSRARHRNHRGRVIFNEIWPKALGFFNKAAGKKQLSDIIWRCYQVAGQQGTVETLDHLKELGFARSDQGGHLHRNRRHDHPEGEADRTGSRLQGDQAGRAAVSQGHHHGRRALQQDHRYLDPRG